NRVLVVARAAANAVALEICGDDSPGRRHSLGTAKTYCGRHRLVARDSPSLGTDVNRCCLGGNYLAHGSSGILVVHAGAGWDGVVRAFECFYKPSQPRSAHAEPGSVSHAGRNVAALGIGYPASPHGAAREDRRRDSAGA